MASQTQSGIVRLDCVINPAVSLFDHAGQSEEA
jgi:hypothetical protein